MANEKGVWRTIGGRRVFIKEGQDLASAMKESGKFKSASKGTAKKEMTKEEKVFEDFKNSDGSKENFEKALNKISEMEYNNEINPDEYKNYISKVQKEYVEKNRKAGEENDLDKVKRIQGDLDKKGDKLTKEEKAWKEQLANTQKELESGKSREDIIKDLDREASKTSNKELASNSGQESISKDIKVKNYEGTYIVTDKGANIGEFKTQAEAEKFAQSKAGNQKMNNAIRKTSGRQEIKNASPSQIEKGDLIGPKHLLVTSIRPASVEKDGYSSGYSVTTKDSNGNTSRQIISDSARNTIYKKQTTNQSMNDALRNAFNDYRKKHKNSNMSFTEFMRMNKK